MSRRYFRRLVARVAAMGLLCAVATWRVLTSQGPTTLWTVCAIASGVAALGTVLAHVQDRRRGGEDR